MLWLLVLLLWADRPAPPYLRVYAQPAISLAPPGGGAPVTIHVRIEGKITAETEAKWYCPKVEWHWPDGTVSSEESDCEPFAEAEWVETHWSQGRRFPSGEWPVVVELSKAGRVTAKGLVTVHVG